MARFFKAERSIKKNDKHHELLISKLDTQGAGIGYLDNKTVFVEGALPTERVLVQFTDQKKSVARAKIIKQLSKSPKRIDAICTQFTHCGGCQLQHIPLEMQRAHKAQSLTQWLRHLITAKTEVFSPLTGEGEGYRRRTRVSLQWQPKTQKLLMGFRKKQANDICHIDHCPILAPSLNALLSDLYPLLSGVKHPELLGHLELVKADNTNIVLLRLMAALDKADEEKLIEFAHHKHITLHFLIGRDGKETPPQDVKGKHKHLSKISGKEKKATNAQHTQPPNKQTMMRLVGDEAYYQEDSLTFFFEPNGFIQVNKEINGKMLAKAMQWLELKPTDLVLDLYCGLGNFTLPIAKRCQQVFGIEGVEKAVAQAKINAKANGISNAGFYQADLDKELVDLPIEPATINKILLDPARAGANELIDKLEIYSATHVLYVSCNPASLARDGEKLLAQGYQLSKLIMLDMFPHTSHLESMALFVRSQMN